MRLPVRVPADDPVGIFDPGSDDHGLALLPVAADSGKFKPAMMTIAEYHSN
jgi:hypothetical protein